MADYQKQPLKAMQDQQPKILVAKDKKQGCNVAKEQRLLVAAVQQKSKSDPMEQCGSPKRKNRSKGQIKGRRCGCKRKWWDI